FRNNGAEVIKVGAPLDNWPGTMWRFLAINDPEVEYVIFRDADSIICYRDAAAVSEWIKSGTLFHTIRDSGSHTALILAGMWGAKAGAVPD
ncbi:tetratricopeptide repeat protein, partial [Neisseria sp. P0001.S004]